MVVGATTGALLGAILAAEGATEGVDFLDGCIVGDFSFARPNDSACLKVEKARPLLEWMRAAYLLLTNDKRST